MPKIISLLLCLVLGGFILVGCSNSSEPFEEKSYTPDTQINEINLDVRDVYKRQCPPQPCPPSPCNMVCADVECCPRVVNYNLFAEFRIPRHRCVKRVCAELTDWYWTVSYTHLFPSTDKRAHLLVASAR